MPKLVGILNITPDSFSDGGKAATPDDALKALQQLLDDGADVIDIGAESTRPNAQALTAEEEWQRLEPILAQAIQLTHGAGKLVSLDTRHATTAQKALELDVDWINDVCGFNDPAMLEAVKESDCKLVAMHSVSVPVNPQENLPDDCDVIAELNSWMSDKLEAMGVGAERVIFDPGIGFGKSAKQSLDILCRVDELKPQRAELLIGHSRKSFMKLFTDAPADQRDDLTLAFSAMLAAKPVDYLRVHNVARHTVLLG